jgi:hypothetical protein
VSFTCSKYRHHTLHIDPFKFDAHKHRCPHCDSTLVAEVQPPPPGFVQFDHTFTPEQAWYLTSCIPPDSYHWHDIEHGKGKGKVLQFTRLMIRRQWRNETLERGFYEHPIRWDEHRQLTHGVMRLLACAASGQPFTAAVSCPEDFASQLQEPEGAVTLSPSGRPAQWS